MPPDDRRRLGLLHSLAVSLEVAGRLEEAEGVFDEAIEAARRLGDPGIELRAISRRMFVRALTNPGFTHDQALAAMREVIPQLETLQDETGLAEALLLSGIIQLWAGQSGEALGLWERALEHAGRTGQRRLETDVRRWMGLGLSQGLTPAPEAIDRIQKLLRGWEDDAPLRAGLMRFLTELEAMQGRFAEAYAFMEEGTDLAIQLGMVTQYAAGIQRSTGFALLLAGETQRAEEVLREAVETLERIKDFGHLVSVAADLALVLLETEGRERDVIALADRIDPFMIEDDADAVVRWDVARARALSRLGGLDEAERLARRAVDRAATTDYSDLRALSHVGLGQVLQHAGRMDEAALALETAITVYEAKGNVVQAASARRLLEELEVRR